MTLKQRTLQPVALSLAALMLLPVALRLTAQTTQPVENLEESDTEAPLVLSPFEVKADENEGYTAATTLAGNRLNTELRDIGNSVTVITSQFLKDVGATNNETLLQYTAGTEVGNIRGNFAGLGDGAFQDESNTGTGRFNRPNQNTRVRGLAAADNTRDYFLSDIPWDSYNVDRVDLQRGPNSILFGLGSPAGLLNVGTKQAGFRDDNEIQFRLGSYGSARAQANFNKVIIPNQLAVRIDALRDRHKFQQDPAHEDNDRVSGALRWEPAFLRKGSSRTILKANFENGNIASNRPRTTPPIDRITPWFASGTYEGIWKQRGQYRDANGNIVNVEVGQPRMFNNLNRETFNPFQLQDDNTGRPNHGQTRPVINGGPDQGRFNTAFNPWMGNFGDQFGGVNAFYADGNAAQPASFFVWESRGTGGGIGPNGAIDDNMGRAFHRPGGLVRYDQFAANAGLPYYLSGLYRSNSLTDASIFDFYNNLLDGPNKWEWNDWNSYNVNLVQTFLDDRIGFEATRYHEDFKRGQVSLLTGDRQAIFIDFNSVYSDGTPEGLNGEPWQDGTPNPNVGRPFITDSGRAGNSEFVSKRDATRLTGFVTHDFNRDAERTFLRRVLGKHTLTGLYSEDAQEIDNRNWQRYSYLDNNYRTILRLAGSSSRFNSNEQAVNRVIYLTDSLAGRSTLTGANIPNPGAVQNVTAGQVRVHDTTWIATGVDPAAMWLDPYYPPTHGSYVDVQADNPANYRGFVTIPLQVTDAETSRENRDLLTTGAQLTKSDVASKALVWQGYFWDGSIVSTFGYRKDTAKAWGRSINANNTTTPGGHLDLNPANYSLPDEPSNVLSTISRSYSIVAHLNQLPFLSKLAENLPVEVTFFYNSSSNFQPAANRVDVYGLPLDAPSGKTIDRGILIESKDRRYSLKVNKYVTTLKNSASTAFTNGFFIGDSQVRGANWANRFEYNWSGGNNSSFAVAVPDPTRTDYNYGTDIGETMAMAQAREAAAVAGWRAWQAKVDPRFYQAWGINLNDLTRDVTAAMPQGFTIPEDSQSSGYEIEFNATPTRNWRLTVNATKTNAIRTDVGGASLTEFITNYQEALTTTAAGDLRIWWGGAGNDTALRQWFQNSDSAVGPDWNFKALSKNQNVPELREWRFNAISNYTFSEGRLKGFRIGGGVRWQDEIGIGVKPVGDPYGGTFTIDPADPVYYGPREVNFDAWIGYGRRLPGKFFGRNVDWDIQLNVTNVGDGDALIPITSQPDGTPASYRIAPSQYWSLTNTLRF